MDMDAWHAANAKPYVPDPINAIVDIPGLFIGDITIPQSTELLKEKSITHVLSLTNLKDKPCIDEALGIESFHANIDDNPLQDMLMRLEGLCEWISHALSSGGDAKAAKVLVHCVEGKSRSGAVVVGMLMRSRRGLNYDAALKVAQSSRREILPNSGFADQLRLWAGMGYSVFEFDGRGGWKVKSEYEEWRANRGVLLSRDEEKEQSDRRREIAELVARLR